MVGLTPVPQKPNRDFHSNYQSLVVSAIFSLKWLDNNQNLRFVYSGWLIPVKMPEGSVSTRPAVA